MLPSSRRSVVRAIALSGTALSAGCSTLGGEREPPVDVSVLNSTPNPVTIDIAVVDRTAEAEDVLFSDSFDLEPYQPGTRTQGSDMDRQAAFRAAEASIVCAANGQEEQFTFEASCVDSDSGIDEGFTVEWADDKYEETEFRYRQSRCGDV